MLYTKLSAMYQANQSLNDLSVMLWSKPGIGKTQMVKKLGRILNKKVVTLIGSIVDPTDLGGIPVVSKVKVTNPDGTEAIHQVLDYAHLKTLEVLKEPGNILFVDELTTCPLGVQAALLQIILDCRFNDFEMDRSTFRIAAGNFTDMVGTHKVNPALMNRFCHLFVKADAGYFSKAILSGFAEAEDPAVITDKKELDKRVHDLNLALSEFVLANPECVESMPETFETPESVAFTSPRSWEFAVKILAFLKRDANPKMTSDLLCGCVGQKYGKMFLHFLNAYSYKGVDIPAFIKTPGLFEFPEDCSPDDIERIIASAMYFYEKDPEDTYKLMQVIFNKAYDMKHEAMIMTYARSFVRISKERIKGFTAAKFSKDFKFAPLIRFLTKDRD